MSGDEAGADTIEHQENADAVQKLQELTMSPVESPKNFKTDSVLSFKEQREEEIL